ncbi:MAG: hypothetical protein RI996_531, partial [Candidatus Parcubacteria bacterium]
SLHSAYISALTDTARYYGLPYSDVFELLLPKSLFVSDFSIYKKEKPNSQPFSEICIEQSKEEAILYYNTLIANETTKTIFIIAPNIQRVKSIQRQIEKRSDRDIYVLHSTLTEKKQLAILNQIHKADTFVCICTPQYLSLLSDSSIICIDQSESEQYISFVEPHIDYRHFIRECALQSNSTYITSDIFQIKNENTDKKYLKPLIVDMTDSASGSAHIWQSAALQNILAESKDKNVLLYVPRRGLATETHCGDCNTLLTCSCSNPLVLATRATGVRYYECLVCARSYDMSDQYIVTCKGCGSWNMKQIGIGTELVADELKADGYTVFRIDSVYTKTEAAIRNTVSLFENTRGTILVSTDISFEYLTQKVDIVVAVTLDSLLLKINYQNDFQVLRKIRMLQSMSMSKILLQTRIPKHSVYTTIEKTTLTEWKKAYVAELNTFMYPPFGVLLHMRKVGTLTERELAAIEHFCVDGTIHSQKYRAYTTVTVHFSKEVWQENSMYILYELRKILTKSFSITVE